MTESRLTGRLREILRGSPGRVADTAPQRPEPDRAGSAEAVGQRLAREAAAALGGDVIETPKGPCVCVTRTYPADHRHGIVRIGDCADALQERDGTLAALAGIDRPDPCSSPPGTLLFVDLETTGLSGGAGTCAFLVGCAAFDEVALRVEQFFMIGHALERALLAAVRGPIEASDTLVTYNGKSFDVPVLETRFLFHREPAPFADRPHIDMLHTARRLWRGARSVVAAPGGYGEACTLASMEQALCGFRRYHDVSGFEIPTRFFAFLRSSDARPLAPVFEHNRLDLISLAVLTARAARLLREDPQRVDDAREAYGVGRMLEARGDEASAERWFTRAVMLGARSWHAGDASVRVQALRALALRCRREGRYCEAAAHWEAVVSARLCPPALLREALEALAIHHEHRSRDLDRARQYAERTRTLSHVRARADAVEHRLTRLRRKLSDRQTLLSDDGVAVTG
jgi:uncharacterized protein YprB with RNaseH-like and TPR domain